MLKDIFAGICEAVLSFFKDLIKDYQDQQERDRLIIAERERNKNATELVQVQEEKQRDENNSKLTNAGVSDRMRSVREQIKSKLAGKPPA